MSFGRSPGEGSVCSKMIDLVELVSMSISFRGMQRERVLLFPKKLERLLLPPPRPKNEAREELFLP
jgi:hypothetical protein